MKKLLLIVLLLVAACASSPQEDVYTIGGILPLTGDGAVYGLPAQRAIELALADVNEELTAEGKRIEIIWEDGLCSGKGGLQAAQKLVNLDGVNMIYGGGCSGETLGLAPFTEANQVLVFSSVSSSPEITNAGDYVFRIYPSDTAQVQAMVTFLSDKEYTRAAILSENNDYAQALRQGYLDNLPGIGIEVVADEVVQPANRDFRAQITKLQAANPELVILLPQTVPMGIAMAEQLTEAGVNVDVVGNDVFGLPETIDTLGETAEGVWSPDPYFATQETEAFKQMTTEANCDIGLYCAASYDGMLLLAEVLQACGDEDTECMKNMLYNTQGWSGEYTKNNNFDENGDVAGNFRIYRVVDGEKQLET